MTAENLPVLVASDRPHDADVIARVLGEEFARVHVSTEPPRAAQDLVLRKPGVLVLAFDTLAKAERHLDALRQPEVLAPLPPMRVLLLCAHDELQAAYEACRKGRFDDFVPFFPRGEETRPLRMAVRRALAQVEPLRDGAPTAREFAALARRLAVFEPMLAQPTAPAATDDPRTPLLETVRALGALAERTPPLVLVVDDDRFQHKLLAQALGGLKLEFAAAVSAADAFASLQRRRPDLILMDVSLPDLDGVRATRALKACDAHAAIPVIMITGVGGRDMVLESLKAGAADFVVKPFDRASLLAKVRRALWGRVAAADGGA